MNAIFSAAIWSYKNSNLTNTMKVHKWYHDVVKNDAEWYKMILNCKKNDTEL